MKIEFSARGYPQTKGSTKAFMRPGMRYPVITNDNAKNKAWEQVLKLEAQRHAPAQIFDGPVSVMLTFHMVKPKSYPKTRVLQHTKKPDIDKLVRSFNDAMTGVIWRDDSQVVNLSAMKKYSDTPGVDVVILLHDDGAASQ